ncbi:MAG: hypothetical protein AAF390_01060 [Pseudomonadota bacterium]
MFLILAAGAFALSGVAAEAQTPTLRNTTGPAEIPPASFQGSQYVDSRGCVFIRAGLGGQTRWVPRVNRDRTLVCGQPPSLATAAPAPAPARPVAPVRTVEPVLDRTPAPAPAPRRVTAPAPRVAPAPVAPPVRARPATPAKVGSTRTVPGYRMAWDDGRLNPNRGPRSAEGNRQQSAVWNSTVPATLVRRSR